MKRRFLLLVGCIMVVSSAFCTSSEKQVVLSIEDSLGGFINNATIYFDIGVKPFYTFPQDAPVSLDSASGNPVIYSFTTDGVACSSNGAGDFATSTIVPLGVQVQGGQTYIISASQIYNFSNLSMVILEDRLLGISTDLRKGSYSFSAPDSSVTRIDYRFFLLMSYPPQFSTIAAGCENTNGSIAITEDSSIVWTNCTLSDSGSAEGVLQLDSVVGNFSFSGLNAGTYIIEFAYGDDAVSQTLEITGNEIVPSISASTTQVTVGEEIDFSGQSVNSTGYEWDFGDSTQLTGVANPEYAYSVPGTYEVMLICTNSYGCTAYDSITINVSAVSGINMVGNDPIKIISADATLRILIDNVSGNNYSYELYDISGRMLNTGPITSPDFTVALNNPATGIYIVAIKTPQSEFSQKVFISQ